MPAAIQRRFAYALFPAVLYGCTAHAFCTVPFSSSLTRLKSARLSSTVTGNSRHRVLAVRTPTERGLRGGSGGLAASAAADGAASPEDVLVQYIVVRADLQKSLGWPLGSVIAQGAHAVSKTLWELRDEENVKQYCGDIDSMHKVVLSVKSEQKLKEVSANLEASGIKHRLWMEQPESIPTALATMPYPRSVIKPHLKSLQLMK